jgi:hypothetical protein
MGAEWRKKTRPQNVGHGLKTVLRLFSDSAAAGNPAADGNPAAEGFIVTIAGR